MALQRLKEAAEKAKIELSAATTTSINLPYITAGPSGPLHMDMTLSRAEFQRMTQDLLDRCKGPFEQAIKDAASGSPTWTTSSWSAVRRACRP